MGLAAWPSRTGAAEIDGRFIRFGKKGGGDIVVVLPLRIGGAAYGIHGEIECKTGGGVQSKHQKAHMRMVRGSGGVYLVARSADEMRQGLTAAGFGPGR